MHRIIKRGALAVLLDGGGTPAAPVVTQEARLTAPPIEGLPLALRLGAASGGATSAVTLERETDLGSGTYEPIPDADETYVLGATEQWRKVRATVTWTNAGGTAASVVTTGVAALPAAQRGVAPFLAPHTVYQTLDESTPVTAVGQVVQRVSDPEGAAPMTNASSSVTWVPLGGLYHPGVAGTLSTLGQTIQGDNVLRIFVTKRESSVRKTLFHTHNPSVSSGGEEVEAESLERVRAFTNGSTATITTAGGSFPEGVVSCQIVGLSLPSWGERRVYSDGVLVSRSASVAAPTTEVLQVHLGSDAGTADFYQGTIYHAATYTASELDFADAAKVAAVVAWGAALRDAVVDAGIAITFPATLAVFQRQGGTPGGVVRARGTCDEVLAADGVEARWAGGSWLPCTVDGPDWSIEYPASTDGTGDLEVRYVNLAHTATVADVSVGLVYGGTGQSNMYGATSNYSDKRAHSPLVSIFDRRAEGSPPMAPDASLNGWNPAYAKAFAPEFLAQRATATGIPCAMVRCAVGATSIETWLKSVTPPNFEDITRYEALRVALIESQGLDPATYDPTTGPQLCEYVLQQIGETDAASGTTEAVWTAAVQQFALDVYADLGAVVYLSILQDLPVSYATAPRLAAIRSGTTSAVAAEAANALSEGRPQVLYLGPDFTGVDLLAGGSPDGIHWHTDTQLVDLATAWETAT
jgi:hypothetical protein